MTTVKDYAMGRWFPVKLCLFCWLAFNPYKVMLQWLEKNRVNALYMVGLFYIIHF